MAKQTSRRAQLWSQLFSSLVVILLLTDEATGSPFLPRSVARQFLTSADAARAKRERSVLVSRDSGLMELEGWQELLTARKRTADADHIPTHRLRTLEKLRAVRQQVRHLLDEIDTTSAQLEGQQEELQDAFHQDASSNYGNTGTRNQGNHGERMDSDAIRNHGNDISHDATNVNHGNAITEQRDHDNTQRPDRRGGGEKETETLEALRAQLLALERSQSN